MPDVISRGEVVVTLSAEEVTEAVEHAAWTAAVKGEPGLAVVGEGKIESYGQGYRVTYTRKE